MEFDGAKENIQPLATGRNASILQATLRESHQELQAQRQELEQAIQKYVGDDPLEAWYNYIIWIEQSFPSGGKESGLEEVLTKCLTHFEPETRYNQDRRLIKLYIKFIDMHKDPLECYQQLFGQGIGTMVADLYISWAYCYDVCGNYRKADEIFRRGIACRAQPLEELIEAHQHFGFIVSQRLMYKDDANETELANQQLYERRMALSSLRSHRKKVGSLRTGSAVKSYVPGTVQVDSANNSARRGNAQVAVFSDENQNPNFSVPTLPSNDRGSEEEKKSVIRSIIDATRDQENLKEPGPWNKAHEKKKSKLFGKNTTANLGFSILEDNSQTEATSDEKPANTSEILIEKPFKPFPNFSSKNRQQIYWPTPVTVENETQPRTYPQYKKYMLYPRPNMEFQLEELRAYNWFRKLSITNKFTEERDAVWGNNRDSIQQIRQYPNFAQKSRSQKLDELDNFFAAEKKVGMTIIYDEVYDTIEKEEMQFEEILFKRWQNGERKLRYNANDTIIISTEMEETFCMPQDVEPANRRKSFFPARKSIFQKILKHDEIEKSGTAASNEVVQLSLDKTSESNDKQINVPKLEADEALRKSMENIKIFVDPSPSTSLAAAAVAKNSAVIVPNDSVVVSNAEKQVSSDVPHGSFEFKAPALPITNIKNKIPFEIFEEPAQDQAYTSPQPDSTGIFDADETCSTQVFNCFIKAQSVSTPNAPQKTAPRIFGTILKEKPEPEHEPEQFSEVVTGSATIPTSTTASFSPLQTKQLSTILETSENGTTKSISSPEYETDPKISTARNLWTQHTTNLETVKEQSCEISTRTEKLLGTTLPKTSEAAVVNSTQVEDEQTPPLTAETPAASRVASLNFKIFEDVAEAAATAPVVNITAKQVGNFSRIEEREDTASGISVRPIKFQEDKTETVPRVMFTSKPNFHFQEDKTTTLPEIFMPSQAKFEEEKNPDTLSKIPIKLPEAMDDSFDFFAHTPPKYTKSVNNQTSLLLGFDVENSPIGVTAPKLKCNYNTPELREKMSFLRSFSEAATNEEKSNVKLMDSLLHRPVGSKESFMFNSSNSNLILNQNESGFIKDSQPHFVSNSKLRQPVVNPVMKSVLRESFHLPDCSFVMDSQPQQSVENKWKQNQDASDDYVQNVQQEHILTDSFMKDFSAIRDPLPKPNASVGLKFLTEKSICNASNTKPIENILDKSESKQKTNSESIHESTNEKKLNQTNAPDLNPRTIVNDFFEYNAETAQFAPNVSAIKNSTVLFQVNDNDLSQFKDKSLHIKDEQRSITEPEVLANQQEYQKNSSVNSPSLGIEFKVPLTIAKKTQIKTCQTNSLEESDEDDCYNDEMSIYVKHTPKTPTYQRHIWMSSENLQDGIEDDSNQYVQPEFDLNQTQLIVESICSKQNINPFDADLINTLLEQIDFINYIRTLSSCELVGRVKQLHKDLVIKVHDTQFKVLKLVGEGAYGAIFCAVETSTGKKYALKQERPANYWEYYICLELRSRLSVDEMCSAYMSVDYALVGNNASILISDFSTYGSIIAVCNKIKKATMKNVDEYVVMFLACQLLEIVDHLHACEIIHADIKADNFLLMKKLSYDHNQIFLTLIDFGVSIDMRRFKEGQSFTFVHKDNTMKSIEMRENRPWTYQLDLYGLAGVIHVLLFGKYMDVEKNATGVWMHKTHVPRYLNKSLWEMIFKSLLNIRDCKSTSMPNLQKLRTLLKEEMAEKENMVIKKVFDFNRALES